MHCGKFYEQNDTIQEDATYSIGEADKMPKQL